MSFKRMDERKEKILRATTDEYISSAEPVGSRTIARKYNLGLSPATIRNEMADLEESGFLQQPHTSAGRIPSVLGYRYYVDALMEQRALTPEEESVVRQEFEDRRRGIDELLVRTSRVLSQLTHYPAMVLAPEIDNVIFRHVQLVPIDATAIMVLVVTSSGSVEHSIMQLDSPIPESDIESVSNILNRALKGRTFSEIRPAFLKRIRSEAIANDHILEDILRLITNSLRSKSEETMRVNGTINIIEQPEFKEVDKLKPLLSLLSEGSHLSKYLSRLTNQSGVQVIIGEENHLPEMTDCSVVTATYEVGGRPLGIIGVLGPTRMEYNRVVSAVEYVAACLNEMLMMFNRD
ncbi:MAG: heat-inducible transcriptional repressor HrcA [Bacillota bacterium]